MQITFSIADATQDGFILARFKKLIKFLQTLVHKCEICAILTYAKVIDKVHYSGAVLLLV